MRADDLYDLTSEGVKYQDSPRCPDFFWQSISQDIFDSHHAGGSWRNLHTMVEIRLTVTSRRSEELLTTKRTVVFGKPTLLRLSELV